VGPRRIRRSAIGLAHSGHDGTRAASGGVPRERGSGAAASGPVTRMGRIPSGGAAMRPATANGRDRR